jgi:hypothetical protein
MSTPIKIMLSQRFGSYPTITFLRFLLPYSGRMKGSELGLLTASWPPENKVIMAVNVQETEPACVPVNSYFVVLLQHQVAFDVQVRVVQCFLRYRFPFHLVPCRQ